ncbi:MAG TPA: amino acid adenylation domain-containing protein [Polyangiaceae bacterium]|nr:amino acid adenylation domain-containing protein [Polyangiaceae bacterium]
MTAQGAGPARDEAPPGSRLSPQQRYAWALCQRGASPRARALVRVEGRLDPGRLARAVERVAARHEILRTTFRRDARLKFPLQVVTATSPAWRSLDRGRGPADGSAADVAALWREALKQEHDPLGEPPLSVTHVRHSDGCHDLLLCLPALCADAWTLRLLARELAEAYDPHEGGEEEPIQYAQFAEWQRELLLSSAGRPHPINHAPVTLAFEGAAEGGGGAREAFEFELDAALASRLEALARGQGASLADALLAAWQAHLARLGGANDLTIDVCSPGRKLDDLAGVMGPVAKWLPVSCRVDDSLRFDELVRRARAGLDEVAEEEEYFDPAPPAGEGPPAPVGFEFESLPGPQLSAGLSWQLERVCTGPGSCRLALSVRQGREGVRMTLWHDPRRLGDGAAACLAGQYVALLRSAAEAWTSPVGRLSLLGPEERARRLAAGRGKGREAGAPECLHRSFEAQARRRPGELALVCGDVQLTYRELNERANRLAHGLRRRGAGVGSAVGLCCERGAGMIVGLLGILKAGGAYVPLDPHAPAQRLADQVRHAGLSALVTQGRLGAGLPADAPPVVTLDAEESLEAEPSSDPGVSPPLDELASIIFTSGSTGAPKGVAVTHRGVASYTRAICETLGAEPGLHFATVSTLSADLGNTSVFASLASGGCLHVILYETATDGRRFAEYCRRHPIDVLKIVPSHLGALLDAGEGSAVLPRRWLVLGGEALPLALADRIAALSEGCAVLNHYGPTETTVGSLALPLAAFADRRGCGSVPIGRPLPGDEAYVLDERLEPAPVGTTGELYLGGAGLARGYAGQPAATAERFVPHPFAAGARLYRTGDRARYRPDGSVEFVGRRDHQLKIRGFRVELGEIEARIREHPAVSNAAAVAYEDGPSGRRLAAYVVARDRTLDETALRAFLKERLPEYMLPADVMWLPSLPLTPNGKVDRRALPRPEARRREHVAPRTAVEQKLASIWAEALGLARVSVEDDFFDLGGHSLLAIPLMHRVQQELGGSLSLAAIFEARTVSGLARLLEAGRPAPGVVTLRGAGSRPPLFCVDPTGRHATAYQSLADAIGDGRPVFGLELGPALTGEHHEAPSIRSITDYLAGQIRARRPRGPYLLLGWSTGGVLALGTARALQEQGERVDFLGVLDTQTRAGLYVAGQPDMVEELAAYVDPDRRAELLALPPAELLGLRQLQGLDEAERVTKAAAWAQARGFLPADVPPGAFRARYALLRAAALFMAELPPHCLKAPIHAWWSRETVARHGRPPVDWQQYTSDAAHVEVVAGDHLDAVQGRDVCSRLRRALEQVPPG